MHEGNRGRPGPPWEARGDEGAQADDALGRGGERGRGGRAQGLEAGALVSLGSVGPTGSRLGIGPTSTCPGSWVPSPIGGPRPVDPEQTRQETLKRRTQHLPSPLLHS